MRRIPLVALIALVLFPRTAGTQGNPLGPEFRVNTYTTSGQTYSSVAADASGRLIVVWSGVDDASGGIFGQRYDSSGVPLGPEFRVNTYTTGNQYIPAVAADSSGNFVVVWSSYGQDGSYSGVYAQRFDSSGAPLGPEFRVNSYTSRHQRHPSVAVGATGDFVVTWESTEEFTTATDTFGQRYLSSGVPVGPEFRVNTTIAFSQFGADVAADSSGNFVVVWASEYQGSPNGPVIWGQRYASTGVPLGPEFRVGTVPPNSIQLPSSVESTPTGDFVVVWYTCCSFAEIFGQRFAASGAPLGTEFRVNTFTTGYQSRADIALDASGNFVVVWTSAAQDGAGDGIFGQRYDSSGAPLGPEFRVNTYTTSDQRRPSVAADALGRFVVVWDSQLQDGSGTGVFGQRYAPILPVELVGFTVE
jgi:hypothetical protein